MEGSSLTRLLCPVLLAAAQRILWVREVKLDNRHFQKAAMFENIGTETQENHVCPPPGVSVLPHASSP